MSLVLTIAAYATGTVLVGLITAHGVERVGTALLDRLASDAPGRRRAEVPPPPGAVAAPILRREAAMTPSNDKWVGQSRPGALRLAAGPQFGSSARDPSRWPAQRRPWGFDDDEADDSERPEGGDTYRTLCVRLCDGYYFPVSFAVTQERLGRDREVCAGRCGSQGRLFVHRNPGGSVEDMQDLEGRPYRQLRTAFLYRTEYVPSCACQAHPWEAASQDRHRAYALALAARNGSVDALKELRALQIKVRQAAAAATTSPGDAELARRDSESLMLLGGDDAPKAPPEARPERAPAPRSDPDWVKRAFSPSGG